MTKFKKGFIVVEDRLQKFQKKLLPKPIELEIKVLKCFRAASLGTLYMVLFLFDLRGIKHMILGSTTT